ncbi:MAG: trehalose-6-phosphate synthase [Nevskia sp.]|nr:trehalose-6-phosphate synthase [Nevskia sp.]
MNRLVAVSNRVGPVRGAAAAGGLAVAVVEALRDCGGLWFGWSGKTQVREGSAVHRKTVDGVELAQIELARDDYEHYYNGFANLCLWPLLHFRIDLTRFSPRDLEAYRRVNRHFAGALRPLLRRGDLVWVHDYHLFLLGAALRKLGTRHRIGFFLHVPFPPADLMVTLPCHQEIVAAMFDYDLVGFQTEPDLQRFGDYIERIAGGRMRRGRAYAYGRSVVARAFPIGIDAAGFSSLAHSAGAEREYQRVRSALGGREQIIGVDRLDYTKGLLRRLAAYEALLERHADARTRVDFLQIAPISRGEIRAYREFRRELELAAAQINGRFAGVDWTPVRYLNRALPRSTLAGLYRASGIGLVTPMRDGMNLVAKEYVAAQEPQDPGVLVLSRFAGAAQQLHAALLVNPYDTEEMTQALQAARTMGVEERRNRHAQLMQAVGAYDVARWREDFVECLRGTRGGRSEPWRQRPRPAARQAPARTPPPTILLRSGPSAGAAAAAEPGRAAAGARLRALGG